MYDELYLTSFFMDESERICANCQHRGTQFMAAVTVRDDGPFGRVSHRLAPCRGNAVEMDAGEGDISLPAGTSHCFNHAAFSPLSKFLQELEEPAEAYRDQETPPTGVGKTGTRGKQGRVRSLPGGGKPATTALTGAVKRTIS